MTTTMSLNTPQWQRNLLPRADTSPPMKTEVSALPLDTSSQVSAEGMEASMESNPHQHFSHSSGPQQPQWQSDDGHCWATGQCWSSLSTICFLSKGLQTLKGKGWSGTSRHCYTSKMPRKQLPMKGPTLFTQGETFKPGWSVPRQSWRPSTSTEWPFKPPGQSGAANSRSQRQPMQRPSGKMQLQNPFNMPHSMRNMKTHVQVRGMGPRGRKQELPGLPLSTSSCLMPCFPVSQRESTFLLPNSTRATIIIIHQSTPSGRATTFDYFSQVRTQMVSTAKKMTFFNRCAGRHVNGWGFTQGLAGRTAKLQEREDRWLVLLLKAQSSRCLQSGFWSCKRGKSPLLHHSLLGLGSYNMDDLSDIFRELAQGAGLLGESIYEIQWHGMDQNIWNMPTTFFSPYPRG